MSAPATLVHWEQPGFVGISEDDGHGDTCAIDASLGYLNRKDAAAFPLTYAQVDAMRAQAISWGLMDTPAFRGMTVSSLAAALHNWGVTPVKVVPYSATLDFQAFRADLIAALKLHQVVIFETANAAALPDNQPGVQYHFVIVGGIDSAEGYWTLNGDTETALRTNGVIQPVWYGVGALEASQPVGYIILPALDPIAPPPPPPPDIKGALANLSSILAAANAAIKQLEQ